MKNLRLSLLPLLLIACTPTATKHIATAPKKAEAEAPKYSFHSIWKIISQNPYRQLPQTEVSYSKLGEHGKNTILADAKRTIASHADILPPFEKLAHPNGICLKGIWKIMRTNPYSGYFTKGTHAPIIVRASSALSRTRSGEIRSLGFAGKIFPTANVYRVGKQPTANFFLIDDLGGTDTMAYTATSLSNAPALSFNTEVLKHLLYGLKVSSAFKTADQHPTIRQLYEISYLGARNSTKVITPRWMKVEASHIRKGIHKGLDFRKELQLSKGEVLTFDLYVSSSKDEAHKIWKKIGKIVLTEAVSSAACDQRLHFHHPAWRDDLQYLLSE